MRTDIKVCWEQGTQTTQGLSGKNVPCPEVPSTGTEPGPAGSSLSHRLLGSRRWGLPRPLLLSFLTGPPPLDSRQHWAVLSPQARSAT